jgi:hypothetical protein
LRVGGGNVVRLLRLGGLLRLCGREGGAENEKRKSEGNARHFFHNP